MPSAYAERNPSSISFQIIWSIIRCWHSFWYVTDGWKVYPGFIESEDHLVGKTYPKGLASRRMTRVEGGNTRLRHWALERTDVALQRRIGMGPLLAFIAKPYAIPSL